MKEDFLHYLWRYKKIPLNCTLTSGEPLQILSFGTYNTLSGPDFESAQLLIADQHWAGNVEMHLKSSHWYTHKHEQDPAYCNVILHVVWEHDIEVFDSNNNPLPTLELQSIISPELLYHYQNTLILPYEFIPCEKQYTSLPSITLLSWHERLFIERLEEKASLVQQLWQEVHSDWEMTLFIMLLKLFGGTVNGEAFLQIGKSLPFSIIRKERTHPLRLEALLLGQAQLLPSETPSQYTKALCSDYAYIKQKHNLSTPPVKLHFTGLRPQGFPTIRLAQLAQLYEQQEALFSQLLEAHNFTAIKKLFNVELSYFWETHYTFAKTSKKTKKPLSDSFIALIWINVIIPIKYWYYKTLGKEIGEELIEEIKQLPAENNSIINAFKSLPTEVNSAFDSQVLLQQYKHYCQHKRCLDCAIGIALLGRNKC